MHEFVKTTTDKIQKRKNVIKKFSGNDRLFQRNIDSDIRGHWRSVLCYGARIWSPSMSSVNWNNIRIKQIIALRTMSGCVKMTNIDNLHWETNLLTVKTHTDVLAKTVLVGCHQSHRSDYQTKQHPVERLIKPTFRTTYGVEIQHLDKL